MKRILVVMVSVAIASLCIFNNTLSDTNQLSEWSTQIPPDDLYLLDKVGIPTEEFMQQREEEISSYKKQRLKYIYK